MVEPEDASIQSIPRNGLRMNGDRFSIFLTIHWENPQSLACFLGRKIDILRPDK